MANNEIILRQWNTYKGLFTEQNETDENEGGPIELRNPWIPTMDRDFLYHLHLSTDTHDLQIMFGDVKFICMGGKVTRMESAAKTIMHELGLNVPLVDLTAASHRFSMFKVGPVICVNHGMGEPSLSILLNEIIKLVYYAKIRDPIFFRIGTSGGIGVEPGTVVIANKAVNGYLKECYEFPVLGETLSRPTKLHPGLAADLQEVAKKFKFPVVPGTTMSALDFYEGQARLDGAFCDYNEEKKLKFLKRLYDNGVRNLEMEAALFSAMTYHAGIKSAVINATFLDRLKGDQVTQLDKLEEWERRPQEVIARYIKLKLERAQN